MLNFTLIGAGRIGKMHAQNIANHPLCNLLYIYDVDTELASSVAETSKAKIASSAEDAINDKDVDAVFIASATNTHIDYIILAAQAGKAIYRHRCGGSCRPRRRAAGSAPRSLGC